MENSKDTLHRSKSIVNSNNPSHYYLLTIAIVIGLTGVFLRFLGENYYLNLVSNIIFIIGIIIALKGIKNILG